MARIGAVAFTDDGDGIASAELMRKILLTCRAVDRAFLQHCQDATLAAGGVMNAGPLATRLGLGGWPALAEEVMLERDLRINRGIGAHYHAQHLSAAGSVEILRAARAAGQPVTGEASPHHLLLTEEACAGYDAVAKVNPPLRAAADVEAIRHAVADGTITILGTDHAPHTPSEKARDFTSAPFGMIGLECALPLYAKALVESGLLDWSRLLRLMTVEPARLLGLDRRPGLEGIGELRVAQPQLPVRGMDGARQGRGRDRRRRGPARRRAGGVTHAFTDSRPTPQAGSRGRPRRPARRRRGRPRTTFRTLPTRRAAG
jgi:dihydroorotase